jgi:ATP/maltotriose-dependent transcriptional regulator MalT
LEWTALAHVALCRVLQDSPEPATELLRELVSSWRKVRALASGEWIGAAAHAAAFAGREASLPVAELLDEVPHRTRWVEAARQTVAGGVAAAAGDLRRAVELHTEAAQRYASMPNETDRMFALTAAVRCGLRGEAARRVTTFAAQHRVPGLLRLANLQPAPPPPGSVDLDTAGLGRP